MEIVQDPETSQIIVHNRCPSLSGQGVTSLQHFRKSNKFTDTVFTETTSEKCIYANMCVLNAACPVIYDKTESLNSNLDISENDTESKSKRPDVYNIGSSDISVDIWEMVLEFIYLGKADIPGHDLKNFLRVAVALELTTLEEIRSFQGSITDKDDEIGSMFNEIEQTDQTEYQNLKDSIKLERLNDSSGINNVVSTKNSSVESDEALALNSDTNPPNSVQDPLESSQKKRMNYFNQISNFKSSNGDEYICPICELGYQSGESFKPHILDCVFEALKFFGGDQDANKKHSIFELDNVHEIKREENDASAAKGQPLKKRKRKLKSGENKPRKNMPQTNPIIDRKRRKCKSSANKDDDNIEGAIIDASLSENGETKNISVTEDCDTVLNVIETISKNQNDSTNDNDMSDDDVIDDVDAFSDDFNDEKDAKLSNELIQEIIQSDPIKSENNITESTKKRRGRPRKTEQNSNKSSVKVVKNKPIKIKKEKTTIRKRNRRLERKRPFNRMSNVCNLCGMKFETYDPKALAKHKK